MMGVIGNGRRARGRRAVFAVAASAWALAVSGTALPRAAAAQGPQEQIDVTIPAQDLNAALLSLTQRAGLQIAYEADKVAGRRSAAVQGRFVPLEALSHMLAGTGLTFRVSGGNRVTLEPVPQAGNGAVQLGTLRVEDFSGGGGRAGDNGRAAGWDGTAQTVYATPGSVSVISKETLDAYPAQSPADMLRGVTGVISGEARTSGGLDVNIRGLQGQGRVPVTVDGAINGTTVYRGYQGTSNRSFVDPDFISHVSIEKGPSNSNAIAGGIGGSVSMKTLGADDIVPQGDTMALRVKASVSNNSTEPGSNMTRSLIAPRTLYGDPMAATRERDRPGFLSPRGGAASFVFARKDDRIDLLAGYSLRRTGNYFAGRNSQYAPRETGTPSPFCVAGTNETDLKQLCDRAVAFYDKYGSTAFAGGEQVLNTSTDTESVLMKASIRPADDHSLELGYGGYWSTFGENYPGAMGGTASAVTQNNVLSQTSLDRFTARYRWNPDDDAIDLKINGWLSKMRESAPSLANSNLVRRYVDSWGADVSNSSRFGTPIGYFSADYGLSYLHEKAGPVDRWIKDASTPPGREGTRKEVSLFTQMALLATDWLRLDGGMRYQHYTLDDRQSGTVYHGDILKRSEDAFNYSLGAVLMPVDGVQIFANYKHAARLPSLMEATTGFFYVANPDLHKEVADNWEFGANYSMTSVVSDDDSLGLKLVWFDNDVDGYIARRWMPSIGSMQMFNIDAARFRGLEGNIGYKVGGFSLDAGATYYDRIIFCRTAGAACVNSSLASDFATNYIPPRWSANLAVNQTFLKDRAMLGARLTYMGKRAIGAEKPASGFLPLISAIEWHPYTLVDVTGSYKLNDAVAFNWSIDNLTDRYYNEAMSLGYIPAPGRTFRIGITSTLGRTNGLWPGNWFGGRGNADAVDWSGPYVGADFGYGMGKTKGNITTSAGVAADLENGSRYDQTMRNMLGGLHAGFNHQFANDLVLGVEGDIAAGNIASWSGLLLQQTADDGYSVEGCSMPLLTLPIWSRVAARVGPEKLLMLAYGWQVALAPLALLLPSGAVVPVTLFLMARSLFYGVDYLLLRAMVAKVARDAAVSGLRHGASCYSVSNITLRLAMGAGAWLALMAIGAAGKEGAVPDAEIRAIQLAFTLPPVLCGIAALMVLNWRTAERRMRPLVRLASRSHGARSAGPTAPHGMGREHGGPVDRDDIGAVGDVAA
ncbi:TonB-dependent receptor [Sphingomonadaceae bacterium jetA1]|jgi:hemoglobin/transferrin/lactoferrin receptor protein|uniref:TonB-dependent receptor domain-containing protein n=1 Tax=Facivitalis istanbulensis TaxID=3075838 RepID=UPI00349072A6